MRAAVIELGPVAVRARRLLGAAPTNTISAMDPWILTTLLFSVGWILSALVLLVGNTLQMSLSGRERAGFARFAKRWFALASIGVLVYGYLALTVPAPHPTELNLGSGLKLLSGGAARLPWFVFLGPVTAYLLAALAYWMHQRGGKTAPVEDQRP